jgi:hypothetical protein
LHSGLYLCIVRRIVFAWILLVSGSLSMGLLPLTLHLCCEEARCHDEQPVAKANCCSGAHVEINANEEVCVGEAECCDDVAFFNLAPFFSWGENQLRLAPVDAATALPQHLSALPEINCGADSHFDWYDAHHPPTQSHLPVFLACRRLLI